MGAAGTGDGRGTSGTGPARRSWPIPWHHLGHHLRRLTLHGAGAAGGEWATWSQDALRSRGTEVSAGVDSLAELSYEVEQAARRLASYEELHQQELHELRTILESLRERLELALAEQGDGRDG